MKLEKNEYTTQTFLALLKEKYGSKINDKDFTSNDVAQYLIRGYTPHRYGNIQIGSKVENGIRIIIIKTKKK